MIDYCYAKGCKNKNICVIYSTLVRYQKDISVSVNSCKYCSEEQVPSVQGHSFTDPAKLEERTRKIRQLSHPSNPVDAPQTIGAVRKTGMKFDIDDKEVS